LTTIVVQTEPDLPALESALDIVRKSGADVIVSVGGGSVLDLGKAIAALAPGRRAALDHLEVVGAGLPLDHAPLPFVAIPTTAGTGAEMTKNAVISVPGHGRKVSLRDDRMLADLAIVDPALTDNSPRAVTLASGLDAITQVIEPYLSCRANPLTDALCRAAIPRGLNALAQLMEAENPAARDDLAFTSFTSGIALANSGLGAVHGLAGVLGGRIGAPHGALCGRLLPPVLAMNLKACQSAGHPIERFQEVSVWIAQALGGDETAAVATLESCMSNWGLPRLGQMGLTASALDPIANEAEASSSMKGNPVALKREALVEIMSDAL
jgi:alcohol dehydrogenase class IV